MVPFRVVAVVSALTVSLGSPVARAETRCPSELDPLPTHQRVIQCLTHARKSQDSAVIAETRLEVFRIVRKEYDDNVKSLKWVQDYGDTMVLKATEGCEDTDRLSLSLAREVLTACRDVFALHIKALEDHGEGNKPFMQQYRNRRDTVAMAIQNLPPEPEPPPPPPPPPPVANAPRPHPGHQAGLGIGVALTVASLATIIGADRQGAAAAAKIPELAKAKGITGEVCTTDPALCNGLVIPRALVVTGAIGLAAGVALTTTFAVLLSRAKQRPGRMAFHAAPARGGLQAGLSLRF